MECKLEHLCINISDPDSIKGCPSGFICERNECIDKSMFPTTVFISFCDYFLSGLKDKVVRFETKKTNREVCSCTGAVGQSDKVMISAA
jgi:hypothetical protein